jgi:signal transduction histidine kinase/ActR/RegA family two-component response regulator
VSGPDPGSGTRAGQTRRFGRPLLCAALAGAGGFVLNGWPVEVFNGVHFVWGGLLYLLVALVHGPRWGFLAAAIASSRTIGLWGHPYGWITLSLEGLVVGWLVRRRRPALIAELLYWGGIGMPLIGLLYGLLLPLPGVTTWTILVKQPVNSLVAMVAAEGLLRFEWVRRRMGAPPSAGEVPPLRLALIRGFGLATVAPLLLLGLVYGRMLVNRLDTTAEERIARQARAIARSLTDHLDKHRQAVVALAAAVETQGDYGTPALNRWLTGVHDHYPGFLTLLAAGRDGRLVGAHPARNADHQDVLTVSPGVETREYFRHPLATGEPFISDVFLGRSFGHDPIVAISAPVRGTNGAIWGIVEGSVDLSRLGEFTGDERPSDGAVSVILDDRDQVIHSNATNEFAVLQDVSASPLGQASRAGGDAPVFAFGRRSSTSPLGAAYVAGQARVQVPSMRGPWRVLVRQASAEVQREAQWYFAIGFTGLLVTLAFSVVLAERTATRVTGPISQLVESMRGLALGSPAPEPTRGPSARSAEVVELVRNFDHMSGRLRESYDRLQAVLAEREALNRELQELVRELDRKVQERTAALAEREQFISAVARSTPDFIAVFNLESRRPVYRNKGPAELLGDLPPGDGAGAGGDLLDWLHPDDEPRLQAHCARLREAANGEVLRFEYRVQRPAAEPVWFLARDTVFQRDPAGRVVQVLSVAQDITAQKEVEENRARLEVASRAAQKLEAVGQLAGGVAHDFNNLLTVILSNTDLLASETESALERQELVRQIAVSARRAADLTRQLLAFSRRQVMQTRPLDLNEFVGNLAPKLSRFLGDPVGVRVDCAPEPPSVEADPVLLEQVVMSLAANARDAMPRGGTFTLATHVQVLEPDAALANPDARPGRFVMLTLADTGCGMDPATLARVFEPFFTTKEVGRGTGLGLATVYGIVRQHQGWVEVASEVGQGTTFRVFLPAAAAGVPAPQRRAESEPQPPRGSETILLVEDEDLVRLLASQCLRQHGYQVLEAANGLEALALWEQHRDRIILLLTDLVMPEGLSGRDLADRLRLTRPRLRVIYTSGYSPDIMGGPAALPPGDLFLPKPYNVAGLLETVRRRLEEGRA